MPTSVSFSATFPLDIVRSEEQAIQLATDLLAQGSSGRAAATASGLSRRQVNKLKELPQGEHNGPFDEMPKRLTSKKQAVAQIWELSARPEGVKRSELGSIFRAHFGTKTDETTGSVTLNMTKHQYRYLKELVQAKEHSTEDAPLFVPEWMPRDGALDAHVGLIKIASDLQDLMTDKIMDLCNRFPGASYSGAFKELVKLAIPNVCPGSIEALCDRNLKAAKELDRRVGYKVITSGPPMLASDAELDVLCV